MIEKLSIKNFKSIKYMEINCKRINLFIGEPNTGKSNILEALGLLSWSSHVNTGLKEYARFQGTQNLFYDNLLDHAVEIEIDKFHMKIIFESDEFRFEITSFEDEKEGGKKTPLTLNYNGNTEGTYNLISDLGFIKFFRFKSQNEFPDRSASFLLPPYGSNQFAVVMANKKLRETMSSFFKNFDLNLVFKPQEKIFEIQKQVDNLVFSYPYTLTSDTLQTILFHTIAIESNQNSTLAFEEPESHAFPYYTKYLGEKIALDESNQYFITTHNPYLLLSILEKAKKDSVNVFVTYFKDYQTKVKCLTEEQLSELMDYDPFFNLNSFIEWE